MKNEKVSIFIIEDHPVMSNGLAEYFGNTGRWRVTGTAASLSEAKTRLAGIRADLVLLDIQLEDGWGLDIIPWFAKQTEFAEQTEPAMPVTAVYTVFDD